MSKIILGRIIEEEHLVEKIDGYLYNRKSRNFIYHKMLKLRWNYNKYGNTESYWKFLIRDSKNVKLNFSHNELSEFNFAYFIDEYMVSNKNPQTGPLFVQFCIQVINQEPEMIFNRYYLGNGGATTYHSAFQYLLTRKMNATYIQKCEYKEEAMFHIFCTMAKQHSMVSYPRKHYFVIEPDHTKYAFEAITQMLKYGKHYILNHQNDNNFLRYDPSDDVQSTFQHLAQNLAKLTEGQIVLRQRGYLCKLSIDQYYDNLPYLQQRIKQLLIWLQNNYWDVLEKTDFYKIFFNQISFTMFKYFMDEPFLHQIFQTGNYLAIVSVFKSRRKELCVYLLSYPKIQEKVLSIRKDGKNILEIVASSRGLSHNIIALLWELGYFSIMPVPANRKSRSIIQMRYNLCFIRGQ